MTRILLLVHFFLAAGPATSGVPVVHCPAEPPRVRDLQMVESWRLSADDEDAPLFGIVSRVRTAGPGEDVYLLDRQLCQILVYSASGEFLRTIGRKGEGPGEFERPHEFEVLPDGRIAVRNGWPAKLVLLHPDGTPAGGWKPASTLSLARYRRVPGGWICNGSNRNEEKSDGIHSYSDGFIARFDDAGEQIQDYATGEYVYVHQPPTYDETQPFFPASRWDLTADGGLVMAASREEYRLEYLDPEGRLRRVVTRDFTPRRRTAADKNEIRGRYRLYQNGVKQEMEFHLLDHDPVIENLQVFRDGSLVVFTCYGNEDLPPGVATRYERHAPDGTLLEQVRILGEYEREYDRFMLLGEDRVVVLRNFDANIRSSMNMLEDDDPVRDDDVFQVIVYDLVEAPPAD
jgi:hypothetical protein